MAPITLRHSLGPALVLGLLSGGTAFGDCPAGIWNHQQSGQGNTSYDEVMVTFTIAPGHGAPLATLPTFPLTAADIGSEMSYLPGDPGFDDFAEALTNGQNDLIRIWTAHVGGGGVEEVHEDAAFGAAGTPDLHWTGIGEIRVLINEVDFLAVVDGGPTTYQLDFTFEAIRACPADANGDGEVGVGDLMEVILGWGICSPDMPCPADVDCDGLVGVNDLIEVLQKWGACGN
jgi:hypothetical protein